jgi:hypothetical protein
MNQSMRAGSSKAIMKDYFFLSTAPAKSQRGRAEEEVRRSLSTEFRVQFYAWVPFVSAGGPSDNNQKMNLAREWELKHTRRST